MSVDYQFVMLPLTDARTKGRWGIYWINEERWLKLVYKSEMDAALALSALREFHGGLCAR